ncbi:exopolyphosphatase [Jeotgalicoccus sp. ATCC 8456]|uniref:exopolyphosphatase n=1 Tax=Jeotgalicoccus sp. ATCC 8456 TaxID=946435 RepID=UPI0018E632F4|nr:exopolyphosphatase [Jeotgalicoccus sp. ATCC 8456]QQD85113.1 exopolyphosphatase [Jeotgalicoccus sp. ATCC 8456]
MKKISLIDIGSNTIRLVIFEYTEEHGLREERNIKTPARLAQYIGKDGNMSEEGILVLMKVLKSFKQISDKYNIDEIYPVATAAIRQSENRDEIVERINTELGLDVKIITGDEEATFGYEAAVHTISYYDAVTIDIGGGSTELTYYEDKNLIYKTSLPFGAVTLSRDFFIDKDHNDKKAIKEAKKFIEEQFKKVNWLLDRNVPIVAIGGSARNIARIHQSMTSYPIAGVHGYTMTKSDLNDVYKLLKNTETDDMDDIDGLSKDRADLILPANLVFSSLLDIVDSNEFKFSRKGLREGMAMKIISRDYPVAFNKYRVFDDSISQLTNDFNIDENDSKKRTEIVDRLYHQLERYDILNLSRTTKMIMKQAASIYYLGDFIDRDASSQHTYYLISNSNINGITHKNRVRLALIASFKNKSLLDFYAKETGWFDDDEMSEIQSLGSLVKFSNALNISNTGIVDSLRLTKTDDGYTLTVKYNGDPIAEEYYALRQKKHFEKILGEKLWIEFTES